MTEPPTVLDAEFLKQFIKLEITEFQSDLQDVKTAIIPIDDEAPEKDVGRVDSSRPLIIGTMAIAGSEGGAEGAGAALNKTVGAAGAEIKRIIGEQILLFDEMQTALEDTIKQLAANQDNMKAITPEAFLDIFEDVDSALGGEDEG